MNRYRLYYLVTLVVTLLGVAILVGGVAGGLSGGAVDGGDLLVGAGIAVAGVGAAVGLRERAGEADADSAL